MAQGGKRKGAGRPPGRRDTATVKQRGSIEELARGHSEAAMNALAEIAMAGQSESARVAASVAILDRGFGKPYQRADGYRISSAEIDHAAKSSADPRIVDMIERVKRAGKLVIRPQDKLNS